MDEFKVILKAVLDASGISESDIEKVQNEINKYKFKIHISADINEAVNQIKEILSQLDSQSGLNLGLGNIDDNKIKTAFAEIKQSSEEMGKSVSATDEKIKQISQSISELGNTTTAIKTLESQFRSLGLSEEEISEKLREVRAELSTVQTSLDIGDNQSAIKQYDQLKVSLSEVQNEYKQLRAESTGFATDLQKLTLSNSIQSWAAKNQTAFKENETEINSFISKLSSADDMTVPELNKIKTAFAEIKTATIDTGNESVGWAKRIQDAWSQVTAFVSIYTIMNRLWNTIKTGASTVKDLDYALVDLKKTTTMTTTELEDFYYASNDVAKQLGTTTEEIISQAAAWSRLGYSSSEAATQMAEYSALMAAISPGMDLDAATDGLVSAMKAFNIGAEDTSEVLDGIISKINIVGNTQAVDNSDIIDILTRSSSAMAAANNTLEETIALGTAATEITRDAASVGNALKTVSMRIRSYDEETEAYSEDLEYIAGEIAELTRTASNPGGISLFTDETKQTYKSTYQILKDISEIWDELSDKAQARLLYDLAGQRQGQVVSAIINNFDAAESSVMSMENSVGNAEAELEVVMDSLEYKLNALSQTGVAIAQNLFNREDMGALIELLTRFAEIIETITDSLGLFGTAAATVGSIMVVKFAKGFD